MGQVISTPVNAFTSPFREEPVFTCTMKDINSFYPKVYEEICNIYDILKISNKNELSGLLLYLDKNYHQYTNVFSNSIIHYDSNNFNENYNNSRKIYHFFNKRIDPNVVEQSFTPSNVIGDANLKKFIDMRMVRIKNEVRNLNAESIDYDQPYGEFHTSLDQTNHSVKKILIIYIYVLECYTKMLDNDIDYHTNFAQNNLTFKQKAWKWSVGFSSWITNNGLTFKQRKKIFKDWKDDKITPMLNAAKRLKQIISKTKNKYEHIHKRIRDIEYPVTDSNNKICILISNVYHNIIIPKDAVDSFYTLVNTINDHLPQELKTLNLEFQIIDPNDVDDQQIANDYGITVQNGARLVITCDRNFVLKLLDENHNSEGTMMKTLKFNWRDFRSQMNQTTNKYYVVSSDPIPLDLNGLNAFHSTYRDNKLDYINRNLPIISSDLGSVTLAAIRAANTNDY